MRNYVPITRERHGGVKWRRPQSYSFAASENLAPLAAIEIGQAALSMPLAFIEQEGRLHLVAVLSLLPGRNLFVAPDGRWLGGYVPAVYRAFPFRALVPQGAEEPVVCIDEASGLLVEASAEGEAFFDAEGGPAPGLRAIGDFLGGFEKSRAVADHAVAALVEAGAVAPWPIAIETAQGPQHIRGLNRVDEAALGALDDAAFLALRRSGALVIAYAQMFSAGLLPVLERLAALQSPAPAPAPAPIPESLDSFFGMAAQETLRF